MVRRVLHRLPHLFPLQLPILVDALLEGLPRALLESRKAAANATRRKQVTRARVLCLMTPKFSLHEASSWHPNANTPKLSCSTGQCYSVWAAWCGDPEWQGGFLSSPPMDQFRSEPHDQDWNMSVSALSPEWIAEPTSRTTFLHSSRTGSCPSTLDRSVANRTSCSSALALQPS